MYQWTGCFAYFSGWVRLWVLMDLVVWHANGLGVVWCFNGLHGMMISMDCMTLAISVDRWGCKDFF